jgi:hypothetical protein
MAIKITRAIEHPEEEVGGDIVLPASLHVDVEIDGHPWTLGGVPAHWGRADILAHVEEHKADILRQIAVLQPDSGAASDPRERPDLVDPTPVVPDKGTDTQALAARIAAIEARLDPIEEAIGPGR